MASRRGAPRRWHAWFHAKRASAGRRPAYGSRFTDLDLPHPIVMRRVPLSTILDEGRLLPLVDLAGVEGRAPQSWRPLPANKPEVRSYEVKTADDGARSVATATDRR